jgi:bacterioferritin-associated ferredoxin
MSDRIICTCLEITEDEVIKAIKDGATSVDEVTDAIEAGSVCGSCVTEIEELIEEHQ